MTESRTFPSLLAAQLTLFHNLRKKVLPIEIILLTLGIVAKLWFNFNFGRLRHIPADFATVRYNFAVWRTPPDFGGLKMSAKVRQSLAESGGFFKVLIKLK